VLPAANRLRRSADFHATLAASRSSALPARGGRRSGGPLVVVMVGYAGERVGLAPRVGFVVSKAVGGAVVRNRTKRRLRELMRARLDVLPAGADVVVRAQPAAASARFADLGAALDRHLARALGGAAA